MLLMACLQYRVMLDSHACIAVDLRVESSSKDSEYRLSIECFKTTEDDEWEIVFAEPCKTSIMLNQLTANAWMELDEGCYIIVPTLTGRKPGEEVQFRLALAAMLEFRVETIPFLQVIASSFALVTRCCFA